LDRIQNTIQHPQLKQRELRHHRIIGGDEATEDRFSYAVSLSDDWGHFCGGSLIAPDVVLSRYIVKVDSIKQLLDGMD